MRIFNLTVETREFQTSYDPEIALRQQRNVKFLFIEISPNSIAKILHEI